MMSMIYMRKNIRNIWKVFGILAILVAAIGSAMAYCHGYGYCDGTCQMVITDDTIEQKAEELLQNATVEEWYSYRYDTTRYLLLEDGEVIGIIWDNVDLNDVSIGSITKTNWGIKAELVYDGKVVGQLYVEGNPVGWQNTSGQGIGYKHGQGQNYNGNGFGGVRNK